jgi:hypothetical protein
MLEFDADSMTYEYEQATFEKVWRFRVPSQSFELTIAETSPSTVEIVSMTQDEESAGILNALLPIISIRLQKYVITSKPNGISRIMLPVVRPPGPPPEWMKYVRMVPLVGER